MMNKFNEFSISTAINGLKIKQFSCKDLVKSCLARINEIDKKVQAFVTVNSIGALKLANKYDSQLTKNHNIFNEKPLFGIPVAVKDNFCTKQIRTTASSNILKNFMPSYESTVTQRLINAGAIIIGKTNMDAWAHGSSTEASDFFITKNPWDLDRLPGGSSGGSAAAVAGNETIFAIGSETAGSIRQPASWCGVTGLKPTYGLVSRYGVIAMASSTDSPGPITKDVADAALVLSVIYGKDNNDATSVNKKLNLSINNKFKLSNITIGIPKQYFFNGMDLETIDAVKEAIELLAKKGAKIKYTNLIDPKYSVAVYTIVQRSEVSSNLARYDGVRYGRDRSFFGQEAKRRIMFGTYALSSGYYDQYYLKAQRVRTAIIKDFQKVFQQVDVLIAPTTPTPALKIGSSKDQAMFGELQDILTEASSLAGLPGININCGFTKKKLPIGMQIIGPQFSESRLLQIGHFYQQLTDWHRRQPLVD